MLRRRLAFASVITLTLVCSLLIVTNRANAQTTVFTYQGKLTEGGSAPGGTVIYEMQFKLFDASSGGLQQPQPAPVTLNFTVAGGNAVSVTNGVFTVALDFGANVFPGANRFLEIGVRHNSSESFVLLSPRQPITSTPYAVRSLGSIQADGLSSACAGCVQDANINSVAGSKVNGTIPLASVPANSGSYIQNTTSQQSPGNFNISGNGTAGGTFTGNIVNASTQYNLGGARFASIAGDNNIFVGPNTGQSNTTGRLNAFFGTGAGQNNTAGVENAFFGFAAGFTNTTGGHNAFFGTVAGTNNTTGSLNAFFGGQAGSNNTIGYGNAIFGTAGGFHNTTGTLNAFFGSYAGFNNTSGATNSFFGQEAGFNHTSGGNNSFFGAFAGSSNTSETNNTFIGSLANGVAGITNATAIGANSSVTQSNSLVLGSINNVNGAAESTKVGIGTTAPSYKLEVSDSSNTGLRVVTAAPGGTVASFGGNGAFEIDSPGNAGGRLRVAESGLVTIGREGVGGELTVYGSTLLNTVTIANGITLNVLGSAGAATLCRNASNQISSCSSSLRYKTNISRFSAGLSLLQQLRPITFDWKQGGASDVGFSAEDVARVNPLFVTYNDKGEVEGVKYDRLGVAFVNAFKEQQAQIERQQQEIDALKKVVCSMNASAEVCQRKDK